MGREIIDRLHIHFNLSYKMLETHIGNCPDELWDVKAGGFVFWQQLLHAVTGLKFWTRPEKGDFIEPFSERNVYPELEKAPEGHVSKSEMRALFDETMRQVDGFFGDKDDEWLFADNAIYGKLKNFDIVEMQIRHIQYHVGHCNAILRERDLPAVGWEENYG